jgi:ribosomal protein S18 acetylase RimI-like enzyme
MATGCTIRDLRASDRAAWDTLWQGYLDFYKEDLDPAISDLTFARLLDNNHPFFGLVAEQDGRLVGLVNSLVHASTWSRQGYCYLEDLYVSTDVRGGGVGRALIEAVYARADQLGLDRVYWVTDKANTTAQTLYDKLATRAGIITYRREP